MCKFNTRQPPYIYFYYKILLAVYMVKSTKSHNNYYKF